MQLLEIRPERFDLREAVFKLPRGLLELEHTPFQVLHLSESALQGPVRRAKDVHVKVAAVAASDLDEPVILLAGGEDVIEPPEGLLNIFRDRG